MKMDGEGAGGEVEGEPRHRGKPATKRKTLRGKRRGKKNISEQEKERLALAMQRWLGAAPPRPRGTTLEEEESH